jgi:hypothetical protein
MKIWKNASNAFEPSPQCFFVMPLTTQRMISRKPVMNIRRDRRQQCVPVAIIDMIKTLANQSFHKKMVQHILMPQIY